MNTFATKLDGKIGQTTGGYHLISLREQEWTDEMPTVARCLYCPESFHGTAAEARAWNHAHRGKHPAGRVPSLKERKAAAKAARASGMYVGAAA